jgi:hypothetical protein
VKSRHAQISFSFVKTPFQAFGRKPAWQTIKLFRTIFYSTYSTFLQGYRPRSWQHIPRHGFEMIDASMQLSYEPLDACTQSSLCLFFPHRSPCFTEYFTVQVYVAIAVAKTCSLSSQSVNYIMSTPCRSIAITFQSECLSPELLCITDLKRDGFNHKRLISVGRHEMPSMLGEFLSQIRATQQLCRSLKALPSLGTFSLPFYGISPSRAAPPLKTSGARLQQS